eukprot:m.338930 g.338930  ORF g.338930 m.338930 type:complete len:458 (-) comp19811_c0_seq32:10-1383(-)
MIRTRLLVAATTSQGRPAAARLAAARPAHLIAHPVYLITLSAASYRQDGKLLVAGEESGRVQVFDVATKNILRQYDAHKRPCKVTKFLHSGSELFSGADDGVVRLWDVPTGQEKSTLRGHEDYVRCGSASVASPHLFVTGAYDHTIKLWDSRMEEPVHSVNHGFPVESVLFFASGGAFVAAGGNQVKVYDIMRGCRVIHAMSNHQKTVTSLCFDGRQTRLLSGSLDRQVKVYDITTYNVVHSFKYTDPVLSVAVSPADDRLVVGMTSGALSVRRRTKGLSPAGATQKQQQQQRRRGPRKAPRAGTYRFFIRGQSRKPGEDEFLVSVARKKKLQMYDKLLKKFKYREALDSAVADHKRAVVVVSVLHELAQRNGLKQALSGRDEHSLQPILQFLTKNVANPRYATLLIGVANMILGASLAVPRFLLLARGNQCRSFSAATFVLASFFFFSIIYAPRRG